MKVVMLKQTAYAGPLRKGEVVDVPGDVAKRWVGNGIAMIPVEEKAEAEKVEVDPYEGKKAKELFEMCKQAGIAVEEKKSRDYYISALEDKIDADAAATAMVSEDEE